MERLEPIRFNYKEYTVNYLKTKYSKYFDDARKMGGATYFNEGRVTIISESEESLEAKVNGTSVYNVKVNFLKKGKIETFCECSYYNETSHYCKHVYASLLASEMIKKREFIKGAYLKNIDILKDIMDKTNNIKLEYVDKYPKCINFIDPVINDMKRELDSISIDAGNAKDYVLSANTVRSFSKVNMFIKDYNYVVDEMESFIDEFNKKTKEDKKRKLREEKKKIRKKKLDEFRKEYKEDKKRIEESKKNRITFGDILLGFFFASAIEDRKKKKHDDLFSLNEEDFDDEVVDEDDYYHDDLD